LQLRDKLSGTNRAVIRIRAQLPQTEHKLAAVLDVVQSSDNQLTAQSNMVYDDRATALQKVTRRSVRPYISSTSWKALIITFRGFFGSSTWILSLAELPVIRTLPKRAICPSKSA
jgi:hypothetical protein